MVFRKSHALDLPVTPAKTKSTHIEVRCDCGFPNNLFIRGHGGGLSWEKGLLLKNIDRDRWVFEIKEPFEQCELKILVNDRHYERGANHVIKAGQEITIRPQF